MTILCYLRVPSCCRPLALLNLGEPVPGLEARHPAQLVPGPEPVHITDIYR